MSPIFFNKSDSIWLGKWVKKDSIEIWNERAHAVNENLPVNKSIAQLNYFDGWELWASCPDLYYDTVKVLIENYWEVPRKIIKGYKTVFVNQFEPLDARDVSDIEHVWRFFDSTGKRLEQPVWNFIYYEWVGGTMKHTEKRCPFVITNSQITSHGTIVIDTSTILTYRKKVVKRHK